MKHVILLAVLIFSASCSNVKVVSKKHHPVKKDIKKIAILVNHREDKKTFFEDFINLLREKLTRKNITTFLSYNFSEALTKDNEFYNKLKTQEEYEKKFHRNNFDIILEITIHKLNSQTTTSYNIATNLQTGLMRGFGSGTIDCQVLSYKNIKNKYWDATFSSDNLGANGINGKVFSRLLIEQLVKDKIIK